MHFFFVEGRGSLELVTMQVAIAFMEMQTVVYSSIDLHSWRGYDSCYYSMEIPSGCDSYSMEKP